MGYKKSGRNSFSKPKRVNLVFSIDRDSLGLGPKAKNPVKNLHVIVDRKQAETKRDALAKRMHIFLHPQYKEGAHSQSCFQSPNDECSEVHLHTAKLE